MSKICIVVPTYNEAGNIQRLVTGIERALEGFDFRIVIVDDNSPDKTAQIAERLGSTYGNILVRRRQAKSGLGSALAEGLRIALSMSDVERIVTLDADLSHNPSDIPRLLSAGQRVHLVQGSRYVKDGDAKGWSIIRILTSRVANLICRLLVGPLIHDCTGNFRVYSRECAQEVTNRTRSSGFEWVIEAMLVARRHRFEIREVPIKFTDRKNGKTKLKVRDIARWVLFATKTGLSAFRPSLKGIVYETWMSNKPSTFRVTSTLPIVSTTMYTLSSRSPGLSDQAELICRVNSTE